MSNLIIGSSQGTLGDSLWLTPIFKSKKNCVLKMFDDPSCRNVAQIFEGLVDRVEFCKNPGVPPSTDDHTHVSQRILNAMGITDVNCLPQIIITDEELEWAKDFLKDYKNPIVFVNNNSGWKDPNNFLASYIKPPREIMQNLADFYAKKYTVMQFGCNANHYRPNYDNFDPLNGTVQIRGLTLRQQAACYKVIGKMISGDTGDPVLMLAVGGKIALLYRPLEGTQYTEYHICYTPELWKDEKIRAKYFRFEQWHEIKALIDFDF